MQGRILSLAENSFSIPFSWNNMPSICHKNIPIVIKNKLISLPHAESLISFARSNKIVDSNLYKEYISRCALKGDYERVAKGITCMEQDGFLIDKTIMNIHLTTFRFSNNSEVIKAVTEEYKKKGLEPDEETFMLRVKHFILVRDFDSALNICSEMSLSSSISPIYYYNALIYVYGKKGDLDECMKIGEKMKTEGIKWNEDTYGEMVKSFADNGEYKQARTLLSEMENLGLIVDSSLHSILLISLSRIRDTHGILKLMEEMANIGLYPNSSAYLTLIDLFAGANDVHMAVRLLGDMQEREMKPPSKIYESLVKLCWNAGDSLSLSIVISKMKEASLLPAYVYLGLMEQYDNSGNSKKSLELGADLVERNETLHEPFYSKLISLYERVGDFDKCSKLLLQAKKLGYYPWVYPSLFISFYQLGNLPVCLEILDSMRVKGNLDGDICDRVVDMMVKEGRIGDATKFLDKMEGHVILSPATYNKLIQAWNKTNRLDICTQLFKKMKDKGLTPLPNTYDALLAAYGKKKDMVTCKQLWTDASKILSESEIGPIYNPMISLYATVGDLKGAAQLRNTAKEKGIQLLESTYITLISAHGKKGELKIVAGLFEEIMQLNVQHGEKLYNTLLRVFLEHGRLEKGPISLASLLTTHGKNQELEKILNDVKKFNTTQS